MELVKPDPLYINGRPHYTLSSYEPLTIVVTTAYVCDEDVDQALEWAARRAGGDKAKLADDQWVQEHFEGIASAQQLREMVRKELQETNREFSSSQMAVQCLHVLAQRLMQRVPNSVMDQTRRAMRENLIASLGMPGMPESLLLARMGMSRDSFEEMVDQQAEETAKGDAALSAWIDHFKLQVSNDEIPALLGVEEAQVPSFLESIRASNQWEQAREAALRSKALNELVAGCTCSYQQETPEQAKARAAQMRAMQSPSPTVEGPSDTPPHDSHPHLKLV